MLTETTLKDKITDLFDKNQNKIFSNDPPELKKIRQDSFQEFQRLDFPTAKLEAWKNTDLRKILSQDFSFYFEPEKEDLDIDKIFQCEVPDFDTHIISLYNGWYVYRDKPLLTLPNGTIIGSFARAIKRIPRFSFGALQ